MTAMIATPIIITAEGLTFAYNGRPVLNDVSFHVHENDFVSVIGPNGGGKTTLLKLMLGLLNPQKGRLRILGKEPRQVRSQIGYVPQQFQFDSHFPVRVIDVVLMGRLNGLANIGRFSKKDREAAHSALEEMDLADLVHRHFADLSGGQRQRVLIARAIASDPKILLLDEPTAHVDVAVQKELYAYLGKLNQRMTVLMVTHDVGFVASYVKSVLCVRNTVKMHTTQEITGEMVAEMYGSDVRFVRHDSEHHCEQGES